MPVTIESEEDRKARLQREALRRSATQAYTPSEIGAEEQAVRDAAMESEIAIAGAEYADERGMSGSGLIGAPAAYLINKFTRNKKMAKGSKIARTKLTKAREAANLKRERLQGDKTRTEVYDQMSDYDKQQRGFGQETGLYKARRQDTLTDAGTAGKAATKERIAKQENQADIDTRLAYTKKRGAGAAEQFATDEQAAQSSFDNFNSLNQFMAASKEGREGGAAPLLSGVQNFLVSFGAPAEGLTDVAQMTTSINSILEKKIGQLGARGLTDKDMEILKDALPRMETSREARETVARILMKSNRNTVFQHMDRIKEEEKLYRISVPKPKFYSSIIDSNQYKDWVELQELKKKAGLSGWQ